MGKRGRSKDIRLWIEGKDKRSAKAEDDY